MTKRGIACAGALRPGDFVVGCGGLRKISDLIFETSMVPMLRIFAGVLNPSRPLILQANQFIRIFDPRVVRLFAMRTALLRVGDLSGLAGITSLGPMRQVNVTLRLSVADAVFAEALWI